MSPLRIRTLTLSLAVGLAAPAAGCASAPAETRLQHDYKVVMLPVDVPQAVLDDEQQVPDSLDAFGGSIVPFALSRKDLAERIRQGILASDVFSGVASVDASDLGTSAVEDWVELAGDTARRESADLILRVRVRSVQVTDLGPNSSKWWSSFLWFMLPAPIWTVDDRTYDCNIAVQAELFDPDDPVRPKASVVAAVGEQQLDYWDRGILDIRVFVIPPPWLDGDPETVSETLTERCVENLVEALREQLRKNVIPSLFDMSVEAEAGDVVVRLELPTTRRLRSLEIRVEGGESRLWAERETEALREGGGGGAAAGRLAYAARVPLGRGSAVRVIAVDEAGGREVRTLRVTDGRRADR